MSRRNILALKGVFTCPFCGRKFPLRVEVTDMKVTIYGDVKDHVSTEGKLRFQRPSYRPEPVA